MRTPPLRGVGRASGSAVPTDGAVPVRFADTGRPSDPCSRPAVGDLNDGARPTGRCESGADVAPSAQLPKGTVPGACKAAITLICRGNAARWSAPAASPTWRTSCSASRLRRLFGPPAAATNQAPHPYRYRAQLAAVPRFGFQRSSQHIALSSCRSSTKNRPQPQAWRTVDSRPGEVPSTDGAIYSIRTHRCVAASDSAVLRMVDSQPAGPTPAPGGSSVAPVEDRDDDASVNERASV